MRGLYTILCDAMRYDEIIDSNRSHTLHTTHTYTYTYTYTNIYTGDQFIVQETLCIGGKLTNQGYPFVCIYSSFT